MNFESTRVVIGSYFINTLTGVVKVYDYNLELNPPWTQVGSMTGPSTNSQFGRSVDMDWDGNRLVIGAPGSKTVHIYDYNGSSWVATTVLSKPADTDFGFSVSISKDIPNRIAASAPGVNMVYIYELINTTWTETFVDDGSDIENVIPIDGAGTQFYVTNSNFNRYGESVRLSAFGNHLIVGQPGTPKNEFTESELQTSVSPGFVVRLIPDIWPVFEYANYFLPSAISPLLSVTQIGRQLGSVRIFKTNDSWLTSNVQIGSIRGDIESVYTDAARQVLESGWSLPGFGMTVDISSEGDTIVVGAPLYSLKGGDYAYHNGQVYTFKYENDTWIKKDVVTGSQRAKLGTSLKLDYTGTRIAMSGCNRLYAFLNVSDWNGNNWFNTQPEIEFNPLFGNNMYDYVDNSVYITNGIVGVVSKQYVSVHYDYLLTQGILGNNLISGYLAADEILIGANNNDNVLTGKFSKNKRISFGGTYNDNRYEDTTIENRMYSVFDTSLRSFKALNEAGRSELLLAKTSPTPGVDLIRLKATEIHLDTYYGGDKYIHEPLLALNYQKNVSIGLPFTTESGTEDYFKGTVDTRAKLDVNGSTYIRNRLNINTDGGNDTVGLAGEQGIRVFDTRNASSIIGTVVYSNTIAQNNELYNTTGTINTPATYSTNERAFDFTGGGTMTTQIGGFGGQFKISLWCKLTQIPVATDDGLLYVLGVRTGAHQALYITPTGFTLTMSGYSATYAYTISTGTWFHVHVSYNNYPVITFHVNGTSVSPSGTSGTLPVNIGTNGTFTLGGGLYNYIGMIMIWQGYSYRSPSVQNLYDNGPPSEMLKVGGDAIIQRRLAIGSTNPTEALEVTGNVVVSGSVTAANITGGLDAASITGVVQVAQGGTGVTTSTGTGSVVLSASPTFTGDVGVGGSLDVGSVLYLTGGTVPSGVDTIVDATNKTNTYISFRESGAVNDWAYLRQIGGNNEYHMAIDFHDDGNDARFSIRDVTSTANPDVITTRFTVKSGGNVGMGVSNPQYALDVSGDVNFTGNIRKNGAIVSTGGLDPIVSLGPWVDDASELALHHSGLDGFVNYAVRQDDSGGTHVNSNFTGLRFEYGAVERMRVHSNGNVGVNNAGPVYNLDVGGTIRASGDVIAFSDGRYKTDVRRIDDALDKVGRVSGYTFRMKDGTERRAGVIAQEMREVLPEVVVGTEETGYNVAYGNMAGLFIEAIKELKARVETLEAALRATGPEGLSPE